MIYMKLHSIKTLTFNENTFDENMYSMETCILNGNTQQNHLYSMKTPSKKTLTLNDLWEEPDVVDPCVHCGPDLTLGGESNEDPPLRLGLDGDVALVTVLLHNEMRLLITSPLQSMTTQGSLMGIVTDY